MCSSCMRPLLSLCPPDWPGAALQPGNILLKARPDLLCNEARASNKPPTNPLKGHVFVADLGQAVMKADQRGNKWTKATGTSGFLGAHQDGRHKDANALGEYLLARMLLAGACACPCVPARVHARACSVPPCARARCRAAWMQGHQKSVRAALVRLLHAPNPWLLPACLCCAVAFHAVGTR